MKSSKNTKCSFYETTGNTNCPFHIIKFTPYLSVHIDEDYRVIKRSRSKRKTARRHYGKSR